MDLIVAQQFEADRILIMWLPIWTLRVHLAGLSGGVEGYQSRPLALRPGSASSGGLILSAVYSELMVFGRQLDGHRAFVIIVMAPPFPLPPSWAAVASLRLQDHKPRLPGPVCRSIDWPTLWFHGWACCNIATCWRKVEDTPWSFGGSNLCHAGTVLSLEKLI